MNFHFEPADAALLPVIYQVGTLQLANTSTVHTSATQRRRPCPGRG